MRFCFHSVRSKTAIPNNGWPSPDVRWGFEKHLTVDPSWFDDFLIKASGPEPSIRCTEITFDDGYRDNLVPLVKAAQTGMTVTIFISTAYIGQTFGVCPNEMLDFNEISWLSRQGVEIGSHGHSHKEWVRLPTAEVVEEVRRSVSLLNPYLPLGCAVRKVAAPHGSFTVEQSKSIYEDLGLWVYGTNECPDDIPWVRPRANASMDGYEVGRETFKWPWEEV